MDYYSPYKTNNLLKSMSSLSIPMTIKKKRKSIDKRIKSKSVGKKDFVMLTNQSSKKENIEPNDLIESQIALQMDNDTEQRKINEEKLIKKKIKKLNQLTLAKNDLLSKIKEKYEYNKDLMTKMDDLKMDLTVLSNCPNLSTCERKFMRRATMGGLKVGNLTKMEFKEKTQLVSKLQDLTKESSLTKIKIMQIQTELESSNKDTVELENQLAKIKEELELVRHELILLYHKELNDGKKCKNSGIYKSIIKIWKLNGEVFPSFFPKILDEQCIEFLFAYSKLLLDKEKYEIKLNQIYSLAKKKSKEKAESGKEDNDEEILLPEKIKSIQDEYKNRIGKLMDNETNKFAEVNEALESCKCFDISNKERKYVEKIHSIKRKIENCKTKMEELKKNELERLSHEFFYNDYQRRFNATLTEVVSTLFGEEIAYFEQGKFYQRERAMNIQLNNIGYFSLFKHINIK